MTTVGTQRRLDRVFQPNAVVYPIDDVLISGPQAGLCNISRRLEEAKNCNVNAVLAYRGQIGDPKYQEVLSGMGRILQLSASMSGEHHLDKVVTGTVQSALQMDAEGVSFHFNSRSRTEQEQLRELGKLAEECDNNGMPLWVHTYARTVLGNGQEYHFDDLPSNEYGDMIAHATSVVRSLGATVVKAPFTGDSFEKVVEAADGAPVVMAGGSKVPLPEFLSNSIVAMRSGARGIAAGRNVFERPPRELIGSVHSI